MEPNDLKAAVKEAVTPVMTAFEEFKAANDARIKEVEKKGSADPLLVEKVGRIESTLSQYEGLNLKMTTFEAQQKAIKEMVEGVETTLNRLPASSRMVKDPSEAKAVFDRWARAVIHAHAVGIPNLAPEQIKVLQDAQAEAKNLSLSPDTAGGYLAPVEYVREIIKGVTEMSAVRGLVRVRTTGSKSVQLPKRTGEFAARWVSEQGDKTETQGLAYGMDEVPTHELFALIDITNQMIEDSAFDMEAEIRGEANEQFSVAEGAAVVSGNGQGKPLGFMAATGVDDTPSGDANLLTGDGLINLYHAIKTAYSRNATWTMNRRTIGAVRRLKGSDGHYLWVPGLATGVPNTINSAPYVELPDMPDVAAGAFPIAFGDFRRAYTMIERLSVEMLRDPYTQATAGNIRFIMRRRVGGQVTLKEAFRKLRVAAS